MRKVVVTLAIVALAASACAKTETADPSPRYEREAKVALQRAAQTAMQAGTVKVSSTIEINVTEELGAAATSNGVLDLRNKRSRVTTDLGPFIALNMSAGGGGQATKQKLDFTYIYTPDTLYIAPPADKVNLGQGRTHLQVAESVLASAGGQNNQLLGSFQDPSTAFYITSAVSDAIFIGEETISVGSGKDAERVKARAFDVKVDPAKAIAAAPAEQRANLRAAFTTFANPGPEGGSNLTYKIWLDEQGRIRQQIALFKINEQRSGVRTQYFGYGEPVSVVVPADRSTVIVRSTDELAMRLAPAFT